MNHKPAFIPRFILLMLLLALPVLACSSLTGGDEDTEKSTTAGEIDQADSTDTQEGAAGSGEIDVDEPAEDSQDSSTDTDAGPGNSDGATPEPTATADAASIGSDGTTGDTSDSNSRDDASSDSDGDESGSGDSDSGDNNGDQVTDPADGPSPGGWGASGSGPQSACDHPYLPLRTGSTWTYNDGQDTLIWEVIDVQGDLINATAVLRITVGDISIDYNWSCAEGTGLASFDFANVDSRATGMEMTLEQTNAEGQFLLPADELVLGATWETNLVSEFTFTQGEGDTMINVAGDMTTVQTNQVISVDPVTFDGQTVDGVQIEQTDVINMVMAILGNSVTQSFSTVNSNNLGRGIGMVTQSTISDFGTTTSQLVSYFIP